MKVIDIEWFCDYVKKKFEKCFVYAAGGKIGSSV
jgi:hypothetical protein